MGEKDGGRQVCRERERAQPGSKCKVNGVIPGSQGGERAKRRVRVRGGTGGTATHAGLGNRYRHSSGNGLGVLFWFCCNRDEGPHFFYI